MVVRYRRLAVTLAFVALVAAMGAAGPAVATTTVLYDGSVSGQKPDAQGSFAYGSYTRAPQTVVATTTYEAGGTTMDSTGAVADSAGYYTPQGVLPDLVRTTGYTLTFTAQVVSETHQSNDRAGFSALILGDDSWGIELGFWQNEVWAQNDGVNDPAAGTSRWTHGEGVPFNTTAGVVSYSVVIKDGTYRVVANGAQILTGPLRKYDVTPADIIASPLRVVYTIPNLLFLGDNTSQAGARARITRVALDIPSADPAPSPSASPSASPTSETPTLTPRAYFPAVSR